MYLYNATLNQWTQLADLPIARYGHCMEYDKSLNRLIVYGGLDASGTTVLNDYIFFDLSTLQWSVPVYGTISGRYYHACSIDNVSKRFYVMNGRKVFNSTTATPEILQMGLVSKSWTVGSNTFSGYAFFGHHMHCSKSAAINYYFLGYNCDPSAYFKGPTSGDGSFSGSGGTYGSGGGPTARYFFSKGLNPCTGDFYVFGGMGVSRSFSKFLSDNNIFLYLFIDDLYKIQVENPDTSFCNSNTLNFGASVSISSVSTSASSAQAQILSNQASPLTISQLQSSSPPTLTISSFLIS